VCEGIPSFLQLADSIAKRPATPHDLDLTVSKGVLSHSRTCRRHVDGMTLMELPPKEALQALGIDTNLPEEEQQKAFTWSFSDAQDRVENYELRMDSQTRADLYHMLHSCGHAVWWSDPAFGFRAQASPCPWCGAQNGRRVPADQTILYDARKQQVVSKCLDWPADIPTPLGLPNKKVSGQHLKDESCCRDARPWD